MRFGTTAAPKRTSAISWPGEQKPELPLVYFLAILTIALIRWVFKGLAKPVCLHGPAWNGRGLDVQTAGFNTQGPVVSKHAKVLRQTRETKKRPAMEPLRRSAARQAYGYRVRSTTTSIAL
jgi:hypothetical protein